MAKTKTKAAPDAATETEDPKGSKKKLIIIAVVVGVVLGAAYFFLLKPAPDEAGASQVPAPVEEGEIVDVGELTVNVNSSDVHYARVGFAVVLSTTATADVVTPHFPLLKDAAISEISRFTPDQLRTPEGGDELRASLTARAKELWPEGEVLRVVLTSLIVQ